MQVYFYKQFKKRQNSTKQPAANSHNRILSCQLKENCSIENPILRLRTGNASTGWQDTLNYAYIPTWGRYYKVTDAVYAGGDIWEVSLVDDALASSRSEIFACEAFIEYSGLSGETYVPDTRLTMRGNATMSSTLTTVSLSSILGNRLYYYMTVVNEHGADCCYELDDQQFSTVCNFLLGLNTTDQEELQKQVGSVFSAITSVVAMPADLSVLSYQDPQRQMRAVKIGTQLVMNGDSSESAWCWLPDSDNPHRPDYMYNNTYTVAIPWDSAISDYRNLSPFTTFELWLPFYGQIELAPEYLIGNASLTVDMVISFRDGTITYKVSCNNYVFGVYTASIGQQVAIAQIMGNAVGQQKAALGLGLGTVNTIASVATGNYAGAISGGINSLTNGLYNLGLASKEKQISATGQTTGLPMKYMFRDMTLRRIYYSTVTTPSNYKATIGAPYMRVDTLGAHEGYYVKTNNASVEISHYSGEADTINAALNSGVYLD